MNGLSGADDALGRDLSAILGDLEMLCQQAEKAAGEFARLVPDGTKSWWEGEDLIFAQAKRAEYARLVDAMKTSLRGMVGDLQVQSGAARALIQNGRELMRRVSESDVSPGADATVLRAAEALGQAKVLVEQMQSRVRQATVELNKERYASYGRETGIADAYVGDEVAVWSQNLIRSGATVDELAIAAFLNPKGTNAWLKKQKKGAVLRQRLRQRGINLYSVQQETGPDIYAVRGVRPKYVRFLPNQAFVGKPKATDVHQGELGDCWLMAPLASIANARPWEIQKLIQDNLDGTYTVHFAGGDQTVSAEYATNLDIDYGGGRRETEAGYLNFAYGTQSGAQWPMIIEKAYAQMLEGYEALDGGSPFNALSAILGGEWVNVWGARDGALVFDSTNLENGYGYSQSVRSGTRADAHSAMLLTARSVKPGDVAGLALIVDDGKTKGPHAFAMLGPAKIDKHGDCIVKLYNPWGVDAKKALPKGSYVPQKGEKNDGIICVNLSKLKPGDLAGVTLPKASLQGVLDWSPPSAPTSTPD